MTDFPKGSGIITGILMIAFIVVIGIFIYHVMRNIAGIMRNASSPVVTVRAELISKKSTVRIRRMSGSSEDPGPCINSYAASFRKADGKSVLVDMSRTEFMNLNEGDTGLLTYRGSDFRSFVKR